MNEYVQRRIIIWTFVLVVVLGGVEARFLFQPPASLAAHRLAKKTRLEAAAAVTESPIAARDVASSRSEETEITQLKLPCHFKAKPQMLSSITRQIRLHFLTCNDNEDDRKFLGVVNQTNGYQASLLDLPDQSQTTDFIPLKAGENHLIIDVQDEDSPRSKIDFVLTVESVSSPATAPDSRN